MKGFFISFEGPDGSGKSTQVKLLSDYLSSEGFDVVLTREPGGTRISELLRNIILNPEYEEMSHMTEALLFAAARAQHVDELIRPSLALGKVVITDRFIDSSIVYQGYARSLGDTVRTINEYAVGDTMPDITFFLDLNPKEGLLRASKRDDLDRLEKESLDFHNIVYESFIKLSLHYRNRFIVIDASRTVEEIALDIQKHIDEYINRDSKIE